LEIGFLKLAGKKAGSGSGFRVQRFRGSGFRVQGSEVQGSRLPWGNCLNVQALNTNTIKKCEYAEVQVSFNL